MSNKPHFLFRNPVQGTTTFRYGPRNPGPSDENRDEIPDYTLKTNSFRSSIQGFFGDLDLRNEQRNLELDIPENIVCLELIFHGYFDSPEFENYYRNNFGLSPIRYFNHNKNALFAVHDIDLFEVFIQHIENFINCDDHNVSERNYDNKIKFIESFHFHTTDRIIENLIEEDEETIYLSLLDNQELIVQDRIPVLQEKLFVYLNERGMEYRYNPVNEQVELKNIDNEGLIEIAQNFDIVQKINSISTAVRRPGLFGTSQIEYPFSIRQVSDLPIIGVADTGISAQTPLSSIIVNTDNTYHVSGGDPKVDDASHGTGVGAFAALGKQLAGNVSGELVPDARLLSIKILSGESGSLSYLDVIEMLKKAHDELGIKLFVLTISVKNGLPNGTTFSDYAFLLDQLAFENDLMVFISTANMNNMGMDSTPYDNHPEHLLGESGNMCSPADSMNNLTVGAIGDNLEHVEYTADSFPLTDKDLPTIYTRKFHFDYSNTRMKNAKLIKPDVLYYGGNFTVRTGGLLDNIGDAGIQYLTSNPAVPFEKELGTSFATPLVANLAAKIIGKYPELNLQSVKALIINSAEEIDVQKQNPNIEIFHNRYICGHGKPDESRCLFSNDNEVTLILEDSIRIDEIKTHEFKLPDYLLAENLKDRSLLKVSGTLCYKIKPIRNNDLAYCPVNISFGIMKNLPLEAYRFEERNGQRKRVATGILKNSSKNIAGKKGKGWSQDAIYKSKVLSNTQKIQFNLSKSNINEENRTFKVALFSHFHKILTEIEKSSLPDTYEFSLVLTIKENQKESDLTGRLYEDIQLENNLEIITTLDAELEIE